MPRGRIYSRECLRRGNCLGPHWDVHPFHTANGVPQSSIFMQGLLLGFIQFLTVTLNWVFVFCHFPTVLVGFIKNPCAPGSCPWEHWQKFHSWCFNKRRSAPVCVVASVCTLRTQQGTFNHHYFSMLLNMVDSKPVTDLYILLCVTTTTLTAPDGTRHSLLRLIRNNNNINKPGQKYSHNIY